MSSHQPAGLRSHLAKYNLDNPGRVKLRNALAAIAENNSAFMLALDETGPASGTTGAVALRVLSALRLLTAGPKGEFR